MFIIWNLIATNSSFHQLLTFLVTATLALVECIEMSSLKLKERHTQRNRQRDIAATETELGAQRRSQTETQREGEETAGA